MRVRAFIALLTAVLFTVCLAGTVYSAEKEGKGTVVKVEAAKNEITVKDEKGVETKFQVKDVSGVKVGDSVTIKDGNVTKAKKPMSGGY